MIHIPSNKPHQAPLPQDHRTGTSTRQENSRQLSSSEVRAQPDGSSTTVTTRITSYQYSETRYTPSAAQQSDTYQLPAQPEAKTDVGAAEEVTAPADNDKNAGAQTVLAFIAQRLVTDASEGASQEELQSRLQAGLDGFLKGFNEAAQQLKDMGLYDGDVQIAVETMFNQVIAGFEDFANTYELENPAADIELFEIPEQAAAPVTDTVLPGMPAQPQENKSYVADLLDEAGTRDVKNLQALLQPTTDFYTNTVSEKEEASARLYDFSLRTRDGDVVTIRSYADQRQLTQQQTDNNGTWLSTEVEGLEAFQFSVDGELDEGEVTAIRDLLSQLNDVADTFFHGDAYDAFNKALDVGFDSSEIARFSLNLTQTNYTRVQDTYSAVAKAGSEATTATASTPAIPDTPANRAAVLGKFVQQLQILHKQSVSLGVEDQLPGLSEFIARPNYAEHPNFPHFGKVVGQMMSAFNRMQA